VFSFGSGVIVLSLPRRKILRPFRVTIQFSWLGETRIAACKRLE
jgi:hypothetical protein